jgi:hypothetical protein
MAQGPRARRLVRWLLLGAVVAVLAAMGRKGAPRVSYVVDEDGNVTLRPEPGEDVVTLEPGTMDSWRELLAEWPEPLEVADSYRPTGGAAASQHKFGKALDVRVPLKARAGKPGAIEWRRKFIGAAQRAGFNAFGIGYATVHIDTGPARWWTYSGGSVVGYPEKLESKYSDRVPPEFLAAGNKVPDLSGVA